MRIDYALILIFSHYTFSNPTLCWDYPANSLPKSGHYCFLALATLACCRLLYLVHHLLSTRRCSWRTLLGGWLDHSTISAIFRLHIDVVSIEYRSLLIFVVLVIGHLFWKSPFPPPSHWVIDPDLRNLPAAIETSRSSRKSQTLHIFKPQYTTTQQPIIEFLLPAS